MSQPGGNVKKNQYGKIIPYKKELKTQKTCIFRVFLVT